MTDELMALLAKATAGEWEYDGSGDPYIWAGGRIISLADGADGVGLEPDNAKAAVAAMNFCRTELPALIAEVERLREALGQVCIDSNGDWKERRDDPQKALDDIHRIAVNAYYSFENSALAGQP